MPKHRNLDHNRKIGTNLRLLRHGAAMTLEEVGEMIGVSMQQVLKYENGTTALPLATMVTLADMFGVSADAFFGDDFFRGDVETDQDVLTLCCTIVSVQDPALRRKIRRVVEILAA